MSRRPIPIMHTTAVVRVRVLLTALVILNSQLIIKSAPNPIDFVTPDLLLGCRRPTGRTADRRGHRRLQRRARVPIAVPQVARRGLLAYEYTRARCHSSLECVACIGILHINENAGGIMAEGPRLNRPSAQTGGTRAAATAAAAAALLAATVAAASAAALSLFASACLTAASSALRPSHGRLSHKVTVLIQT